MLKLKEIYQEVIECPEECCGIRKTKECPPRGFYFHDGVIAVFIVAQNPGKPRGEEKKRYPAVGIDVDWHNKLVRGLLVNMETEVHKKCMEYAFELFPNISDPLSMISFSNIVKCETDTHLPIETYSNCYHRFLKREVRAINPVVILALGSEVYRALKLLIPAKDVIRLPHPSARKKKSLRKRMKKMERDGLNRAKKILQKAGIAL